jgi:hypothetical protein
MSRDKKSDQQLLSPPEIARRRYGQLFVDRVAGLIFDNILGMIFLSLGITSFIQSLLFYVLTTLRDDTVLSWMVAGVVFSTVFASLLALRALRPSLPPPPADYKIETLKIQMEYLTRERAIYSRSFRLVVLQDGLDRFRDTFHWTGSRVINMTSSDRFHNVVLTDEGGLYSYYEVQFNTKYAKGDKVDFTITWDLEDSKRVARPFVSRQVNRPCREMSFFVKLYPGNHESYAVAQIAISPSDRTNSTQRRLPFGTSGVVSWIVRRPQLAYYYELRWAGEDW